MDFGLRGKVALVAAASRGLGRAVALELGNEGTKLVLCARGADALASARDMIVSCTGVEVHTVVADLSNQQHIELVTTEAMARFGQVDILVSNAGGPPAGVFENHQWDAWARAVNLTLRSAVEL